MRCLLVVALLVVALLGATGCGAPRLIQDYAVRDTDFVFAVQEGKKYTLGECQRAPDGTLTNCQMKEVEFQ